MRQVSVLSIALWAMLLSCDTDRNVAPVFETYYTKYYGEDGNQVAVDLLINADGSMILLGNSSSQTSVTPIPYLLKIDGNGSVLWQRQLGQSNEAAVDVEIDGDNNLLVVSNVGAGSDSRIRLFKIDQQGNGIDSILIESAMMQVARSVTQVENGSYLIAGFAGPTFLDEPNLSGVDESDLLVYRIDEGFDGEPERLVSQGGEHVGQIVKVFQSKLPGPTKYLLCGDSDRPLQEDEGEFKRSIDILTRDQFGNPIDRLLSGDRNVQIASTAIETPRFEQEAYLIVGSSFIGNTSDIFITQFVNDPAGLVVRLDISLPLGRRMEGVSAAVGQSDVFFILANEFRDNANKDIFLVKVAGDGAILGGARFGTLEGDDAASAVRVLPDGRVAVFGTIQLETQKKMVLIVLSPDGTFSNG